MNLTLETSASAITVLIQGLISFFSPCVLPLIPLYISYLSGGAKTVDENGAIHYKRSKVLLNTLFFVFGISFAFFLLGLGFTAVGQFFTNYQTWFTRIGGILVILFGLFQLGVFRSSNAGSGLNKEHRFHFHPDSLVMNPFTALIFGFTFSFAWTPCVGPALASVLIMAASAASSFNGFMLIAVYTLGFVLPFMAVGLFTGQLLEFFKKHGNIVKYTVKIGGVLMILIGLMMFTGWMNHVSGYLSGFGAAGQQNAEQSTEAVQESAQDNAVSPETKPSPEETPVSENATPAPVFSLTDQYGNEHQLADYKGKTVFLNFWATWCPPCQAEMPEIQELYEEYGENSGDVIILGIAAPDIGREGSAEDVAGFLSKNSYTYPVVMDTGGLISYAYGVSALPTTFMIDAEGNVFGYVTGQITKDIMENIIQQTIDGVSQ